MEAKTRKKQRKHTIITDETHTRILLKKTSEQILNRISATNKYSLISDRGNHLAVANDSFQSMSARAKACSDADGFERLLVSELLINAENIERQCHGAGALFARVLLQTLTCADQVIKHQTSRSEINETYNSLRLGLVERYVKTPVCIGKNGRFNAASKTLTPTVCRALNLAGLLGTVSIEKYHDINGAAESIIERSSGHRFRVDILHAFLGSLSMGQFDTWERTDVRVLIVDGVLNTVAEIDKILIGATETKQPTLILSSYFEEEIVATVAANNLAGNCDIFLALLPRDSLESVNMANDVAVCCLSTPINAHGGHGMLAFLEYAALSSVEKVRIIPAIATLEIINHKAHSAVSTQIRGLQEKLTSLALSGTEDKVRDASSELLNKRITNLLSDRVVIKVPDSQASSSIPEFDNQIRFAKSVLQYGELNNTKQLRKWLTWTVNKSNDPVLSMVGKKLSEELSVNSSPVPGLTPYAVLWLAYSVAVQYLDVKCAVVVEKD
jgi:hypothetical protein